ncbi:MAG: gamma-glutamylcyclotransferase family protein [Pseudomonadota bacterium]|nr:gamma-glutamylcyclotransferase family protein [Pseudomonadota bacterium]
MPVLPTQPDLMPPLLYFAYGSNMDPVQIRRRCPSFRFVAIASLANHRLAFSRRSTRRRSGVADVVPAEGEEVWGVVYRLLSQRDIEVLDAAEGFNPVRRRGQGYTREIRVVAIGGMLPSRANIYIAQRQKNPPPPTSAYIAHMTRGAVHWGLPAGYREMLGNIENK